MKKPRIVMRGYNVVGKDCNLPLFENNVAEYVISTGGPKHPHPHVISTGGLKARNGEIQRFLDSLLRSSLEMTL